jgi:hypothetical protein
MAEDTVTICISRGNAKSIVHLPREDILSLRWTDVLEKSDIESRGEISTLVIKGKKVQQLDLPISDYLQPNDKRLSVMIIPKEREKDDSVQGNVTRPPEERIDGDDKPEGIQHTTLYLGQNGAKSLKTIRIRSGRSITDIAVSDDTSVTIDSIAQLLSYHLCIPKAVMIFIYQGVKYNQSKFMTVPDLRTSRTNMLLTFEERFWKSAEYKECIATYTNDLNCMQNVYYSGRLKVLDLTQYNLQIAKWKEEVNRISNSISIIEPFMKDDKALEDLKILLRNVEILFEHHHRVGPEL